MGIIQNYPHIKNMEMSNNVKYVTKRLEFKIFGSNTIRNNIGFHFRVTAH